ncbi:MAG: metal-dependent hydrolase [Nitrospirae bacterium]|nr:metal-dependent hydrolase [Nitrospirota bacterium]
MDPITHSLAGITIAQLGFKRKAALWALLLSSIAPDFDYITRFWGTDIFLRYHRGITHGILALFLVPLIIAIIFGLRKGFFYYYFMSFLGYGAHLLMDLTNQYGTRILSPLDWNPYSLDLTFIIDPYISIGLLLCVILCLSNRKKAVIISSLTIIILLGYIGGRYYLRNVTKDFLKTKIDANIYKMCPLPNDFLRWWFIAKSGNEIKVGFADLFTKRVCIQETYTVSDKDPLIESSKETDIVKNFLYFAKYPYSEIKKEKHRTIVVWKELAYSFMPGDHFTARVIFDENDKIVKSEFKF